MLIDNVVLEVLVDGQVVNLGLLEVLCSGVDCPVCLLAEGELV